MARRLVRSAHSGLVFRLVRMMSPQQRFPVRRSPFFLLAVLTASVAQAQGTAPEIVARARAIHERVNTLDTHVDISPANFTAERNYTQQLSTQVDLPDMTAGGLDVAFLIV